MTVTTELWNTVYDRDGGRCICPRLDPGIGPCRNSWGDPVRIKYDGRMRKPDLTFAHIKMTPGGPRVDDERHAVMACWGHHVMGRGWDSMWITSETGLELARGYLRQRYGDDYA